MNTQEQIEKWRAEFEMLSQAKSMVPVDFSRYENGEYKTPYTQATWQGFLMARLSVVIELPNFQFMNDPDSEGRGEYVMREVLEAKLEKQGYKVKQ